jgi:flagellar biosynthesis/type III secretory pathway protein FliH
VTLARARVVKGGVETRRVETVPVGRPPGRVVKQPIADALARAAEVVAAAERRAREIVHAGEEEASAVREAAREQGIEEGAERLAKGWIRLRREEAARAERDLARSIDLARAMAERLLGEALHLDPARVLSLAREALVAAKKARRIVVFAHPADAAILSRDVGALALEAAAIEIHADAARARGSLLFQTDLGTLDADLSLQLDRLAAALRDEPEVR